MLISIDNSVSEALIKMSTFRYYWTRWLVNYTVLLRTTRAVLSCVIVALIKSCKATMMRCLISATINWGDRSSALMAFLHTVGRRTLAQFNLFLAITTYPYHNLSYFSSFVCFCVLTLISYNNLADLFLKTLISF